jgi:hypothetical protein
MSKLKVDTITKADGTGSLSVPAESGTVVTTASPSLGRRNLIINGAMQVAQRGTSSTPSNNEFTADRFQINFAGNFDYEQNGGSVTPPTGFTNYLALTATGTNTPTGNTTYSVRHNIEGYNISHLGFGTSDAKTITLSFWVRSDVTGTYAVVFRNEGTARSYVTTYTISSADTWEQKTITITGDTSGTWNATNGNGLAVWFTFGGGNNYQGTTGSWVSADYRSVSGQANAVAASGNYFYLTGVQLEVGSLATPFEHRSYGEELALCQRYYEAGSARQNIRNPSIADNNPFGALVGTDFRVSKRAAPTIALGTATVSGCYTNSGSTENITTSGFAQILLAQTGGAVSNMTLTQPWTASAEL